MKRNYILLISVAIIFFMTGNAVEYFEKQKEWYGAIVIFAFMGTLFFLGWLSKSEEDKK